MDKTETLSQEKDTTENTSGGSSLGELLDTASKRKGKRKLLNKRAEWLKPLSGVSTVISER